MIICIERDGQQTFLSALKTETSGIKSNEYEK